ncbi:GNAT family N-acetyltransferase [Roseococcus sp. DSY-14]|uniref:GNAT family N-acetyltransferase n=1 Tax=Roseococcus sp. DSY-14 TaxID=3369650 RepID=UPI00387B5879
MAALILAPPEGPTGCFVAFEGAEPVGTASLVQQDLPSRPDLAPWLAGVFVVPEARGRGHAGRLVGHVEAHAAAAGVRTLWLYTGAADGLYARLGWQVAEAAVDPGSGKPVRIMRRALGG